MNLPDWTYTLRNLYWHKRACRKPDDTCRRRAWRKIAAEKKRLLIAGVPYLELHLVTRYLTNPGNRNSYERLKAYYAQGRLFDGKAP
jgi:hypothetical protein